MVAVFAVTAGFPFERVVLTGQVCPAPVINAPISCKLIL
jgi:hypothetical protein